MTGIKKETNGLVQERNTAGGIKDPEGAFL